jgi:hypothetical protein
MVYSKIVSQSGVRSVIMKESSIGRIVLCVFFAALTGAVAFAQSVDRQELERNQAAVDFINYEGPYSRIDTVEEIRTIGYDLGLAIRNGGVRSGADSRYFVIHSVSPADGAKLDADIFGLGVDSGVDHIRNLRLIIQGYLQGAYDYSDTDAALLSRYVTIYNAVFRGDWNAYTTRYKAPVIQNMSSERAGLSIRFDEWPGQTLIAIPLGTGAPGSLSAIDTSSLTGPQVTNQMREDGGAIEDRQSMVDLKEREAVEANQSATLQREAIAEEEQNIQRDREETAAQRQRVEQQQQQAQQQQQQAQQQQQQAQQQAQQAQQQQEQIRQQQQQVQQDAAAGKISPQEAEQKQQELAQQQQQAQAQQQQAQQQQQQAQTQQQQAQQQAQQAQQQQQQVQQREQELAQREQAQDQRRQEAATTEARADQKTQEAQQERREIAKDQQDLIEGRPLTSMDTGTGGTPAAAEQVPAGQVNQAAAGTILAISILSTNSSLGRLVKLNPATGTPVQSSLMNTVNGRTVTLVGGRILSIAGINRGNGAIRLVEISPDTLEMLRQGDDDIHPQSLLWHNGQDLYAIMVTGGKNYLARFTTSLDLQTRSTVEVHPHASCVFEGDRVLSQKADGSPLILNAQTLR